MQSTIQQYFERFAFYLLLFIIFILPLPLGSNRPWAWSIFEALVAVCSIMCVWSLTNESLIAGLKRQRVLIGLFVATQCYVAIQLIEFGDQPISVDPAQTQISLLKGICYCLFICCSAWLLSSSKRIKQYSLTIIITVFLQALYAIYLQFSGMEYSPVFNYEIYERANGSFVYHNHLANYLLVGGALAIGLLISQLSRASTGDQSIKRLVIGALEALMSSKWLIRVAIITIVVGLILTRSRMGNSAFFVSLLATAILALFLMKKPPPMLKWLIVSLVVIDVAIVGAMFGVDKVKERMDVTSFEGESRDDVVEMSIPLVQDVWLTGSGAGSFYSVFPQYHTDVIHLHYDHAHNEYLQFIIEYGITGTLLLGTAVLYSLYQALKALKSRSDPLSQGLAFGAVMAIVGMLMHITVDFPLQAPATTLNFIAMLVLARLSNVRFSRRSRRLI